jgi:hypothetical protein
VYAQRLALRRTQNAPSRESIDYLLNLPKQPIIPSSEKQAGSIWPWLS